MPGFNDQSNGEQANLDAILKSSTYRIAHEDPDLLNSNAMRGVRMLLEITKPDLDLETAGVESTIIVFVGAERRLRRARAVSLIEGAAGARGAGCLTGGVRLKGIGERGHARQQIAGRLGRSGGRERARHRQRELRRREARAGAGR